MTTAKSTPKSARPSAANAVRATDPALDVCRAYEAWAVTDQARYDRLSRLQEAIAELAPVGVGSPAALRAASADTTACGAMAELLARALYTLERLPVSAAPAHQARLAARWRRFGHAGDAAVVPSPASSPASADDVRVADYIAELVAALDREHVGLADLAIGRAAGVPWTRLPAVGGERRSRRLTEALYVVALRLLVQLDRGRLRLVDRAPAADGTEPCARGIAMPALGDRERAILRGAVGLPALEAALATSVPTLDRWLSRIAAARASTPAGLRAQLAVVRDLVKSNTEDQRILGLIDGLDASVESIAA